MNVESKTLSALSLPTVLDRGCLVSQIANFLKCHQRKPWAVKDLVNLCKSDKAAVPVI
jgi:hypothetical protein